MTDLFRDAFRLKITKKERHLFVLLTLFAVFLVVAYFIKNDLVFSIGKTVFLTLGALMSPYCPICLAVLCEPFSFEQNIIITLYQELVIAIPIIAGLVSKKLKSNNFILLSVCYLMMFASFIFGSGARITTLVIHCLLIGVSFAVFSNKNENLQRLLIVSFIQQGLMTSLIILIQVAAGTQVLLWQTRLTFDGSVRGLSNPVAFSCFFLLVALFESKPKKFFSKVLISLLVLLEVSLIVLTYSRGVLISLFIAFCIFLVFRSSSFVSKILAFSSVAITATILLLVLNVDASFMTQGLETASGRFEIWSAFFSELFSGGVKRLLFGFGPGDVSRVLEGTLFYGYYSHSVYVDYFVSFGLLGGLLLIVLLIWLLSLVLKSRDSMLLALLVLVLLMFVSHGNFASFDFHVLLALCGSLAQTEPKRISVQRTAFAKMVNIV